MDLEDLRYGFDSVIGNLQGTNQSLGRQGGNPDPLRAPEVAGALIPNALGGGKHEGPSQQVALDRELLVGDQQGTVGQIFEL
ncbi:MAG TPA: hypothetical protein EYQ54_11430, partial [Myxococcales bacterium]|nr:hypothetical protein [Myxococcales bacterium]